MLGYREKPREEEPPRHSGIEADLTENVAFQWLLNRSRSGGVKEVTVQVEEKEVKADRWEVAKG